MKTALFMDREHQWRFSSCLEMMRREGVNSVRISPAARGSDYFVGVEVGKFFTCLRPDEVDDIQKTADRVDSLPKLAVQFVRDLKRCADHLREELEAQKSAMI